MDDPWGSPWADEIQHDTPIPLPKKQEDLRKKTVVNAPVIVEERVQDAWGVDRDGFGEWASLPAEDGAGGKGMEFDGAGDGWETRHKGANGVLTNGDLSGAAIPWELTPTLNSGDIPKLSPVLPSAAPEILRQPSPDPWSTVTPNDVVINGTKGEAQDLQDIGLATVVTEPAEDLPTLQVPELEEPTGQDSILQDVIKGDALIDQPVDTPDIDDAVEGSNDKVAEIDHGSSRPSSSPSDHEEALPESPRTSLDDEPKRPPVPRKVSSKIQELVEHFDGLARSENEEEGEPAGPTISETKNKPIEDSASDEGFDDDFGDFEDGHSDDGDNSEDRPVTPEPRPSSQILEGAAPGLHTPQALPRESPKPTPRKEFGRVKYSSDPSFLNKIFPGDEEEEPEKIFVPDVIPHDSFSTVEERKTWYRISRYGTMLKHKTGDDENYVRVNWAQSQLRSETLKIVARWMEEDRMSGRVVLGGGSKGSSLFGWNDPNAAPVPLASAFAEKPGKKKDSIQAAVQDEPDVPREWPKGLVRTRSTSKTRSPPKPRRRTSSKSKRNSGEIKPAPPPVASFGWNSQPDSISQVSIPLAPKRDIVPAKISSPPRQSSVTRVPALSPIFSPTYSNSMTPSSNLNGLDSLMQPAAAPPVLAPAMSTVFGLDDDWGEMMSSPINTEPPVVPPLPPSKGLRHKKSQSLSGAFSNPLQPSPTTTAQPHPPQSGFGHRPTASLDKISFPKTETPAASNTDPLSMDVFDSIATSSPTNQFTQPTPTITSTFVTSSIVDPWASADFSFFDSPPAPSKSTTVTAPKPPPPKSVAFKSSPLKPAPVPLSRPPNVKSVAYTPAAASTPASGHRRSKSEVEQDRIVASIVKGLPDLSYMLRK